MPSSITERLKNYLCAMLFLVSAYALYTNYPFYRNFLKNKYTLIAGLDISMLNLFRYIFFIYAVFLFFSYFLETNPRTGKGVYAMRALGKVLLHPIDTFQNGLLKEEKTNLLAIIVKAFFAPLMIFWLFDHLSRLFMHSISISNNSHILSGNFISFFRDHLFWLGYSLILLIDVFFFAIGYLIEHPKLDNMIISVEPTLLGWLVTLICYPPFNLIAVKFISWKSSEFPIFINPYLFVGANIIILLLLGIYSWATLALGFKASNLTHRGIVAKGPYKYVRHPAYVSKNMAWWLGGLPLMISAGKSGIASLLFVLLSLSLWSYIYFLRAITEERHLSSVNSEYNEYMKKVPYRFVPYVI